MTEVHRGECRASLGSVAPRLSPRLAVWVGLVVSVLIVYAKALPYWYRDLHMPVVDGPHPATYTLTLDEVSALAAHGLGLDAYAIVVIAAHTIGLVLATLVAGTIAWRRSDDWLALAVALWLVLMPANAPIPPGTALATAKEAWFFPVYGCYAAFMISQLLVFTLFPSRRFHPRWLGWLVLAWTPMALVVLEPRLSWVEQPTMFGAAIGTHYAIAVAGIVLQYRHAATPEQRHQVKWALFAMAGGFSIALVSIAFRVATQHADPILRVAANVVGVATFLSSSIALVVGFGFSILRYRLWDIDVIVNRSLVYGTLTALLLALAGGGALMVARLLDPMPDGQRSVMGMSIGGLAFGLVFQPTRRRVQRVVDRRIYGIALDYQNLPTRRTFPRPGMIRIGAFENLTLIGRGGMADVYQGEHPRLGCAVALKVLPQAMAASPERRRRLARESRAAAALCHPNIVRVYEHGEADGLPFMVMELIRGRDLSQVVEERGALSLEEVMPIVAQVACALDYAHGHGVIHRDVKPSNVMLEEVEGAGPPRVVLLDFGVAKALDATTQLTQTGVIGSLAYIAPEQIQAPAHVDGRADIYALGVMTYHILTGQLPFPGPTTLGLLMSHLNHPAPDPCRLRPGLGSKSCATILRAMEKDPERRFSAAGEFARALQYA